MTAIETRTRTIGRSVPRREDARLLTGRARFLADVAEFPDLRHLAILRSPHPHARIRRIDTGAASRLPGVLRVFTGADVAAMSRPLTHLLPLPTIKPLEWYGLATDKVRYVGEPLAAVVAVSRAVAEDALDFIAVDYEELPPLVDAGAALADGAALLYEEWGSNEFLTLSHRSGDLDAAFAAADGVLRERFEHHRVIGLPLEGHGAIGRYDGRTGHLLLYASSQQPHNLRTVLADVTGLSEASIRVVVPDMGGGFGNKQHFMREEVLVAVIARHVPFAVSWLQDRTESLTASIHSRQQVHEVEVAYRRDGRLLGLRARVVADIGNPALYFTGAAPAIVTASLLTGAYDLQDYAYDLSCVATSKCPSGAYRGFGQPQAMFTIERVVDLVAEAVGRDPAEVRRLNLIPDQPRPYVSATGARYDTGSFGRELDRVLDAVGYAGFRERQAALRGRGRHVGIGLSVVVEGTAPNLHVVAGRFGGYELVRMTVQPDGHVSIQSGTKSQGQGHETVLAQVAADVLTIPVDHVEVRDGDTDLVPYGMGTWGSRSAVMGGGAVTRAAHALRAKMTTIAAHMLQSPADEVTLTGGAFHAPAGSVPFAQVAGAAYLHTFLLPPGLDVGLSIVTAYDPANTNAFPDERGHLNVAATYAGGAAAAVVEVDVSTGRVRVEELVVAHDCGRVINPMIVEGQIQGGCAQGIGAVLLEELPYRADGRPVARTLAQYHLPRFADVPEVRAHHGETPSPLLGGYRGTGEMGAIVTPAALANAVHDALRPFGVTIRQTNLVPREVRRLLRAAGVEPDPVAFARGEQGRPH